MACDVMHVTQTKVDSQPFVWLACGVSDLTLYQEAGLYDPDHDAEHTRKLLHWLEDAGCSPADIIAGADTCELSQLASDANFGPMPEFTLIEAAEELGMTPEEFDELRRIAGLAPRPFDRLAFSKADLMAFMGIQGAKEMFTIEEANHFARVLGSSLARIAEAAVSLFLIDVEGPLLDAGGSSFDVVKETLHAADALEATAAALDPLLRLHLQDAVRRSRETRLPGDDVNISRLAIGFVDLVGFTAFSERVSVRELGVLVRRFENAAYDLVADHGGRVVKLIGDEVMFVAADPSAACEIAISLITEFRADTVTPRGGLAYGELLTRGGDYYGSIVNLASRIGDMAVPCELLATPELAERCPGVAFEPAGRRQIKGFDEPIALVSLNC